MGARASMPYTQSPTGGSTCFEANLRMRQARLKKNRA